VAMPLASVQIIVIASVGGGFRINGDFFKIRLNPFVHEFTSSRQSKDEQRIAAWAAKQVWREAFDPAAPTARHRHVLLAVHTISYRIAVDAAARLELPQQIAAARVEGVESAVREEARHDFLVKLPRRKKASLRTRNMRRTWNNVFMRRGWRDF